MIKIWAVTFCSLFIIRTNAQKKTTTIGLFDNKLSMSIPSDVKPMTGEQIQVKYHKAPNDRSFYYADEDMSFSIVLSVIGQNVKEEDMIKNKDELISMFATKGIKLEENEIKKIKTHRIIIVSFYSVVPDGKIFNRRFYAVADGKLIMTTFNCTEAIQKQREPEIEAAINSTEIK
jgi:hypothetical protein